MRSDMRMRFETALAGVCLSVLAFCLGLGCASFAGAPLRYVYFEQPAFDDAWSAKISSWQHRERADHGEIGAPRLSTVASEPAVPAAATEPPPSDDAVAMAENPQPPGDLRTKYARFLAERKRQTARDIASWVQSQAHSHYVPDGAIDHWATFEETLRSDGDDCDGLELLTFHALRELGFGPHEVYRAIVVRPEDGQHHMVTLWFETSNDPWVIDPTGAMTLGMPRMSEMSAWVPLKVFSESAEYSARQDLDREGSTSFAVNE